MGLSVELFTNRKSAHFDAEKTESVRGPSEPFPASGVYGENTPGAEEVRHGTHEPRTIRRTALFFEPMSKRRRGYPSETQVKRGVRIVHGDKLLEEKLGTKRPLPVRFRQALQKMLSQEGLLLTA